MIPRLPEPFLKAPLAHRGLHDVKDGRPENSRAAIDAAIALSYGIEIDLQLSADGRAIVFHDYSLDRLTAGTGPVRQRTAEELAQFPLKGGAEGIPTLQQVLNLVTGRAPLLIELKDQDGNMGPDVGPLENATALALEGYSGPVAVMSYSPHSIAQMAVLCPYVPRGLVTGDYDPADWPLAPETCARLRAIPDYDTVQASFISHEATDLARPRVAELKAQGANVLCWTVRSPQAEVAARKVAQNITFEGYLPEHPG